MTKGASMSGASQAVRPASAGSARSGPPTKALAARRRIPSAGSAVAPTAKTNSVSAGLAGLFNSEDGAGLQLGPTVVLAASLSFIGFVILLHIIGKYRGA
eukprot:c4432_g1_i2.p1 GENE.c4432_g1_i2~~c4432_g1_i2.p1  ORF type:complete len:109 (-),score=22.28 c4432_g1_i2:97-396(-)